jgi:hypothetical protein
VKKVFYHVKEEYKAIQVDLIVFRVLKNGNLGMAKPCSGCLPLIKKANIRYVYYTTSAPNPYIEKEMAKIMQTKHMCAGALSKMRTEEKN